MDRKPPVPFPAQPGGYSVLEYQCSYCPGIVLISRRGGGILPQALADKLVIAISSRASGLT